MELSVKDDEMTSDLDTHDEQNVDCFPGFMELGLVDSDHGFVAELDEDSKQVYEADMDGELTLERNTPFLLGIDTDDVHETPVNVNSHDGLSQPVADPGFESRVCLTNKFNMSVYTIQQHSYKILNNLRFKTGLSTGRNTMGTP